MPKYAETLQKQLCDVKVLWSPSLTVYSWSAVSPKSRTQWKTWSEEQTQYTSSTQT